MKRSILYFALLSSTLLVATGCQKISSDKNASTEKTTEMSTKKQEKEMNKTSVGEIIGSYNSDDGKVKGATLPSKSVSFSIPITNDSEYLHFAFMHAASEKYGWYFAPKSEEGIHLNKKEIDSDSPLDITNNIALYAAPDKSTQHLVETDEGNLKYGDSSEFMKAYVSIEKDMYKVTIENISKNDYETPFSSGVWEVTTKKEKTFDHKASEELSTLDVSGHRDSLYVKQEKLANMNK